MYEDHCVRRLSERGESGKKNEAVVGRPLFCFVAYCGCKFMLRRKDPINLFFP